MPELKNLCAHIPVDLYRRVSAAKTAANQTISEYVTQLLTEYYDWKENGGTHMAKDNGRMRTLAFQIDTDLFERIKAHLERETARTGKKLTQRDFVIGLIEAALAEAERRDASGNGGMDLEEETEREDAMVLSVKL